MPEVKVNITGDASQLNKTTAEAQNKIKDVQKSTAAANQNLGEIGSKTSAAGGALSALGTSVGQQFGAAGQVISAVAAGPIGILTAAIGAAVALGVKLWDEFTLSAEEAAAKAAHAIEKTAAARQKAEETFSDSSAYMDRLNELTKREQLSNAEKKEASALIAIVQKNYGDLGITIDSVTGKILGMDKAQDAFFQKSRAARMSAVKDQLKASNLDMNAQIRLMDSFFNSRNERRMAKTAKYQLNTGTTSQRIQFAERMYAGQTTEEGINRWKKILDILRERKKLEEEYMSLHKTGAKNDKEHSQNLQKQSEKARAAQEQKKAEEDAKKAKEQAQKKNFDDEIKAQQEQQDALSRAPETLQQQKTRIVQEKLEAYEAKNGKLSGSDRQKLAGAYGKTFDDQQAKSAADATKHFQHQLRIKQLELQGLHKQAALEKEIYELEKAKGRLLTQQEKNILAGRISQMQAMAQAQKDQADMKNYYRSFEDENPWKGDRLAQMGAKIAGVTKTDYQAKNNAILTTISHYVNAILENSNENKTVNNINKRVFP